MTGLKQKQAIKQAQRGFAVIAAIIMLVIFGVIAAAMLTTSGSQTASTLLSQREMQAWFAAQSGADAAILQLVQVNGNCTAVGACPASSPCNTAFPSNFALGGNATGFNVAVSCGGCACVDEGSGVYAVYQITSTATNGNPQNLDFVSRSASATVRE